MFSAINGWAKLILLRLTVLVTNIYLYRHKPVLLVATEHSAEAALNFVIPYLNLSRYTYVLMLNVSAFHTAISYQHFSTHQLKGTVQQSASCTPNG
jgi:hypothetical protein